MRILIRWIKDNFRYREQIYEMAKANQKKAYKGSDLGVIWAFIKPTMYVCVFYAAITLGFRGAKNIEGLYTPYFIWLIVGMMAWFYMSGMLAGGAGVFRKYRGIVTKTNYPLSIIPTILTTANLMIHLVCITGTLIIAITCFHVVPSVYWLEIFFYMALMAIFSYFWSMATGMIVVFSKDLHNFLSTITQALFWLSAIIFDINSVDNSTVRTIFMFNPITYIVEGYRNAVCRHIWFWEQPKELACYGAVMLIMIILALLCYRKYHKIIPDYL